MPRTRPLRHYVRPKPAVHPLVVMGFWGGAFAASYVAGYALLVMAGMPAGTAPLVSGATTAVLFRGLSRQRRPNRATAREHLKSLTRVTQILGETKDQDELGRMVIGELRDTVKLERIYMWSPTRNQRDFHLTAGLGPDPVDATLASDWLAAYFQPRDQDLDGNPLPTPLDGWLAARDLTECRPIFAHGRMLGLLTFGRPMGAPPMSADDRWYIDQVLRQTGIALAYVGLQRLEHKRRSKLDNLTNLYKAAQKRAITDGLTGLNTHIFFKEQLAKRFSEAKRHRGELSVALIDVDHFKRINDSYGHPMGDEVLRRVSAVVKQLSRTDDTVARYGGEELSLVLPQTDLEGAIVLAGRIRAAVEALELFDSRGRQLPKITVSCGVASLAAATLDAAGLIEKADQALYMAKREGRNQVRPRTAAEASLTPIIEPQKPKAAS